MKWMFHCRRFYFGLMVAVGVLPSLIGGWAWAGNPHAAFYSSDNDKIVWFVFITDLHIGARGTQDSDNLTWVVTQGKNVVAPEFIVATGDLTDCTDGNLLGIPNGPYQSEWNEYKAILAAGGALALATDLNPGTTWCESMQMVIALACRYMGLTQAQAVVAATLNAACAIGRGHEVGSLAPGYQADAIILDVDDYRQLGYRYGTNLVETVIKRGRVV